MPAINFVRFSGGLSLALTLQFAVPAFAQTGQSDWISPGGSSSQSSQSDWVQPAGSGGRKHKKEVTSGGGLNQSGWIKPGDGGAQPGGNVILDVNGAGADMLGVQQQAQDSAPAQQTTQQMPVQQSAPQMVPVQQGGVQMTQVPVQQGGVQMTQAPMQGGVQMTQMVPVQAQMVPVQQQMVPVQMVPVQMVPVQQAVMPVQQMVPVQQTAASPGFTNPLNQPPVVQGDSSMASVVFGGAPGSQAAADSATQALQTAEQVGMIGQTLTSTVGGMLQGAGWDGQFHTYGMGHTYYAGGHGPGGYTTTTGGMGTGLVRGVEQGLQYGTTLGTFRLMNKLMMGR